MDNQQGNNLNLDEIAYAIGFLLGDGCLYCNPANGDYRIQWATMDTECLEIIKDTVGTDRPITPIKGKNCSLLSIQSREYHGHMVNLTAFKKDVPGYYFEASDEVKLALIAGLLDSDGSIRRRKTKDGYWNHQLSFYNNEIGIVLGLTKLLRQLGIRYGVRQYVTQSGVIGYDVRITLLDFAKAGGYFNCRRKQERLDQYKEFKGCPSETRPAAP